MTRADNDNCTTMYCTDLLVNLLILLKFDFQSQLTLQPTNVKRSKKSRYFASFLLKKTQGIIYMSHLFLFFSFLEVTRFIHSLS